ncbi:MAG TPA: hypothetical protein VIP53_00820 [Nitrososphaera sp.]
MAQHWAVPRCRRRRGRASGSARLVTPSYLDEGHTITPLTPHPNDPEYRRAHRQATGHAQP